MINRKKNWLSMSLCAAAGLSLALVAAGCGSNAEPEVVQAAPAPPPAPPAPPKPSVTPISELMVELNIDPRVSLAEEHAPRTNAERRAVLEFFDAIARGNANAMRGMISLADQYELAAMVKSGDWKQIVSKIEMIRVRTGDNSLGQKCAAAVIEVGRGSDMTFQPQMWYYEIRGESALFEAAPTPPGIMDRLSGDWIASWHAVLEEEMLLAEKPDEEIDPFQIEVNDEEDEPAARPSSGGGGRAPRRDPITNPIELPSIPGPAGN